MPLTFRLAEPHEVRPLLCHAKRSPRSGKVTCQLAALHGPPDCRAAHVHAGRDRLGRWHFWTPTAALTAKETDQP